MLRKYTVLFLLLASVGCTEYAEREVREKFDIPIYKTLSAKNIEEAVIKTIPLGAEEEDIYEILEQMNIGRNDLSSYYKSNEKREIVVRFEYDPEEFGFFAKKHYGIVIQLDTDRTLEGVKAHEWLTGL